MERIFSPAATPQNESHRLSNTVDQLRPILLILDPFIRLHRVDENDATQIAAPLSYLRELQRQFQLAVIVVHHARKDSHSIRPGRSLRGSSELHGCGDSSLYLRRKGQQLTPPTEQPIRLRAKNSCRPFYFLDQMTPQQYGDTHNEISDG